MSLAFRDPVIPDSPVARWDPRWKLVGLTTLMIGLAVLRTQGPLILAISIILGLLAFARCSVRRIAERIALLLVAMLPFLIVIPLTIVDGWTSATVIALRCLGIGLVALLISSTIPPGRIFGAMRSLGIPGRWVLVAQLAYRYIHILFGEARRLRIAMHVRAFRVRTNAHTYRTLGHAAGALIVSSGTRAERVAAAMRCRGFDGSLRTLDQFRTTKYDLLTTLIMIMATIALVAWERWT